MSPSRKPHDVTARIVAGLIKRGTPGQLLLGFLVLLVALAIIAYVNWKREPDTASRTGGWYEIHFTRPVLDAKAGSDPEGIEQYLVALMDRATQTLDVCDYDFDLENVARAMAAARKRGVQVRMVTDSDTLARTRDRPGRKPDPDTTAAFAILAEAGIPVVEDNRSAIMHNKFTIVDGEWVQTGSWNYSRNDTCKHNNHMIIIHSRELAENYTAQFEKMFVQQQFGPARERGIPHPVLTIGGAPVENYFAPEDRVAGRLIDKVRRAEKSIYFLAFSFTHDGLGEAIRERASAGVTVGGVFETTGSKREDSEYGRMKSAGLNVHTDGNPYNMHHKVLILDERTVVLGSFNFSASADRSNDENVLIIEDAELARAFKEEYDRVLAWAKDPPRKK